MAIITYHSIIALSISGLSAPIKIHRVTEWMKKKAHHMLPVRVSLSPCVALGAPPGLVSNKPFYFLSKFLIVVAEVYVAIIVRTTRTGPVIRVVLVWRMPGREVGGGTFQQTIFDMNMRKGNSPADRSLG